MVLGDGSFELPAELFGANVTEAERTAYLAARALPKDQIRLPANPLVVDTGARLVLIDAGGRPATGPESSSGWLAASLAAAGIDTAAVGLVLLTHAHPDHLGGLVDPATGALRFPNAEVVLSDAEHALWTASDVERRLPAWVSEWGIIALNRRVFGALGDRLRTVPLAGEVVSGIHTVAAPGHTPGHAAVLVASGGEQLLVVGDAIANAHTQIERPDWHLGVDLDPDQGARTRRRLLERSAADRLLVHGYHLPFPGIGHVVRDANAYRWLPTA